ncbi:3-phosphoshikimate 1-carboxyvinyltransferase [Oleispirillum naphthae]|uniref:3-phosphoshikimate 1-carboxyvinyltransferase n=1 Tax=Oleispirillum naphthae TaxID=2838853 RepID=UPI003082476E
MSTESTTSSRDLPLPAAARRAARLAGSARVPGDKSISHRALMFGALAVGESRITGLLEGEDVLRTAAAMRAMGASLERSDAGVWTVRGVGIGGLAEPADVLDMGNAGTGARLLMGLVATHPITAVFTGDASLRSRPMARVIAPLSQFGAEFLGREGGRLPLAVRGNAAPTPVTYTLPVASAQVKSAVLLAGLNTPGVTTVIEPVATRDHTERLLTGFGADIAVSIAADGVRTVRLTGQPELRPCDVMVPADASSAAFPAVAALLLPGSEILLPGVGTNPLRFGLFQTLREMGADIALENQRAAAGEPVADLRVRASALKGVDVPAARAPSMIDEYPVLAVAAACAEGSTRMRGLAELRVKESDRFTAILSGLAACGAAVEADGDDILVHGAGRPPAGGATIAANLDHRIAMAFLVLGTVSEKPVAIDDIRSVDTSFPGFVPLMNGLGADIG